MDHLRNGRDVDDRLNGYAEGSALTGQDEGATRALVLAAEVTE